MATVSAKTVWLGDKWQIGVKYLQPDGVTPIVFSNDTVPAGEFFLGRHGTVSVPCTIANGKLIVLDQTAYPGEVVFELLPTDYPATDLAKFLAAATPPTLYNRLHIETLDIAGNPTTQKIQQLDIRDPATDTDAGANLTTVLVTVIGSLTVGRTILRHNLVNAGSYSFIHSFDHNPTVWAVDASGDPVELSHTSTTPTQEDFTFPQPFTGTVYMS